jgi:hypothetical protein
MLKLSTILCTTKKKKIRNELVDPKNTCRACAVGVIAMKLGWEPEIEESPYDGKLIVKNYDEGYKLVENYLHDQQARITYDEITERNDNGWSFKKIAKWLKDKGL